MTIASGACVGPYKILGPLGRGGMGEVYRAKDLRLDREVAIKVLPEHLATDAEALKRFEREAKAVAALSHPNILTIHDIGSEEGVSFAVMELLQGDTLRGTLAGGPFSWRKAVEIGIAAAEGLASAHSKGIIHRDLKPENIFLTSDGRIKILDFGLARYKPQISRPELTVAPTESDITEAGVVMGTVSYMSPEQVLGGTVDARSDIFSFGCVLYEMITGGRPFPGKTFAETVSSILRDDPSELPGNIPPELSLIIAHCLEKNLEKRFHSSHDLVFALKSLLSHSGSRSMEAPGLPAGRKNRAKKLATIMFIVLILLTAGVVSWFVLQKSQGKPGQIVRLGILPFAVLTPSPEIEYLGVGITDAIITKLAGIEQIRVPSTGSVLRYKDEKIDYKEVSRELNVDHILTGTIQQANDGLRISVHLVNPEQSSTVWAEQFDLKMQDLLALEETISEKVSNILKVRIEDDERERMRRLSTQNHKAYQLYVTGRARFLRSDKEGTKGAIEAYEKAIHLDPNFALAQAGLATASAEMHLRYAPSNETKMWGERAQKEAERALQLDPDSADVHLALAAVFGKTDFAWDKTIEESRKALNLNPDLDLAHYYIARAFYHLGLLDQADAEVAKGLRISGENKLEAYRNQGITFLLSGKYSEAVTKLEEVSRLSDEAASDYYLALASFYIGEVDRAKKMLEDLASSSSASASTRSRVLLAAILAATDNQESALHWLDRVTGGSYMDHHVAYGLGQAYAQIHREDEAVRWLRKAADTGFPCLPFYQNDPLLEPLRKEREFQKLLAELQKRFHESEQAFL